MVCGLLIAGLGGGREDSERRVGRRIVVVELAYAPGAATCVLYSKCAHRTRMRFESCAAFSEKKRLFSFVHVILI